MAHATDIVAYVYCAEVWCPDCMRTTAAGALTLPGEAVFQGRPTDGDTVEQFLDRWAAGEELDRHNESSYDSDDFPKVVFASDAEPDEQCGVCGEDIR
jgi:hypothetical protein